MIALSNRRRPRRARRGLAVQALLGLIALSAAAPTARAQDAAMTGPDVRTTILRGTPPTRPPPIPPVTELPSGDVSLNFPAADVQVVAQAILGDTLHVPFTVDPSLHAPVTVRTPHPIRRADVIGFFEAALTRAGLVLTDRGGSYAVLASAAAKAEAPVVGPDDAGYGNETVTLKFVNAEEMRKLLDPLVPNAISVSDPTRNLLVISGDGVQRRALRDLVAQFDVDWLKGMSFALLIPQRTDARLIAPELDRLLNAPGAQSAGLVRLIAMDRLNGILAITSQPQYLDDVRRFVEILDREGEGAERRVFVYHVQNGRASDLAKVLNAAFGNASAGAAQTDTDATQLTDHTSPAASTLPPAGLPAGLVGGVQGQGRSPYGGGQQGYQNGYQNGAANGGQGGGAPGGGAPGGGTSGATITADETNNAIVVFSTPRDYALVEQALGKLDVPPLQVMIDASISEVTLNHVLQYGVEWAFQAGLVNGAFSSGSQTSNSATTTSTAADGTTTTTTAPTTINPGPQQAFPGLSFLYSGHNISATLNALRTVTDVTVLSAPKLMVLNNHTATIEVGDQVPISTGSAVSTITSGAPIVNSIEYRDTGIILKVTPRVNDGGLVLLDIAQEVSSVLNQTTSGITSPTIEQRKISTSVAVQNGETIALGGLIKNQVTKGRTTIPLLGSIPVLGHLFGDTNDSHIRTELIVLLTPRVVRTPVDAEAVTRELREKIHEASPLALPPPPPKKHGH